MDILEIVPIICAIAFIIGIKYLSSPLTAKRGNFISSLSMLTAIIVVVIDKDIVRYDWLFAALVFGCVTGVILACKVKMTAMPEMVALFNGFGGLSSFIVGYAVILKEETFSYFITTALLLTIFIGILTFIGSLIAWSKLKGYNIKIKLNGFLINLINIIILCYILLFS